MSKEMLSKLHKPGHVVFQDVSAEGGPTDEYFDEVMRTLNICEDRPESQPRQRQGPSDETMKSRRSSTTEQTSTNPSSTAESGETEEGSNSAIALGSEQSSRRASAVSEAADGAAPMQVIPEEAPMDETSD